MHGSANPRLKALRPIEEVHHRYRRVRLATQAITLAVLFAVPLAGFARLDLWDGRHLIFGEPTNEVYGLGGLLLGILAFYFVTFVVNAGFGRVFCGFGCPVGEVSRLADVAELPSRSASTRWAGHARAVLYAAALAAAGELWLVSPRVLVEGSPRAIARALFGLAASTGLLYAHGRFGRWTFCRYYCPIGAYYSALQTEHGFGVHFEPTGGTCKGCAVCAKVCPVELDPRDLARPRDEMRGIGIEGFPGRNHCLSCGDCVRACEHVFHDQSREIVPLRLSFGGRAAAARDPKAKSAAGEVLSCGGARTADAERVEMA
jgi:polyferredoxin